MTFKEHNTITNTIVLELDTIELAKIKASVKFTLENHPSDAKDLFNGLLAQFDRIDSFLEKGNFAPKNVDLE